MKSKTLCAVVASLALATGCKYFEKPPQYSTISGRPVSVACSSIEYSASLSIVLEKDKKRMLAYHESSSKKDALQYSKIIALMQADINELESKPVEIRGIQKPEYFEIKEVLRPGKQPIELSD
jgi:hypothetical protein